MHATKLQGLEDAPTDVRNTILLQHENVYRILYKQSVV